MNDMPGRLQCLSARVQSVVRARQLDGLEWGNLRSNACQGPSAALASINFRLGYCLWVLMVHVISGAAGGEAGTKTLAGSVIVASGAVKLQLLQTVGYVAAATVDAPPATVIVKCLPTFVA